MSKITELVWQMAEPVAQRNGCTVWDVEFVKEAGERFLRVYIDSDEGVTIEDCERMHRAIDPVLDEADPIEDSYDLEVSSPGIERDLRTDAHIAYAVGEVVELRFFAPVNGKKTHRGTLLGLDAAGTVTVEIDGEEVAFARDKVAKITTVFEF